MAISDWYSDEELISQLAMFIDDDIDFTELLGQITEYDESTFELRYKDKVFHFSKELCNVEEVT